MKKLPDALKIYSLEVGNETTPLQFLLKANLREISMIKLAIPVKTRLPIRAWLLAGAVTVFSLASSLMHPNPHHALYAGVTDAQVTSPRL